MINIHPRVLVVSTARRALSTFIDEHVAGETFENVYGAYARVVFDMNVGEDSRRWTSHTKFDSDLRIFFRQMWAEHELTEGEAHLLIAEQIAQLATLQILTERRSEDPEKKGGET